ncbi:hypothetical protein LCGC14_2523870 [marine sediment metagenome]|uniref:Uncharacterized protein n=1 Tax=marine sediment metagenome TaxID=412755 RepID=A0A0F9AVL8_9ZZZZ
MTAFDKAWEDTGRAEGGYVDDPSDSGGRTNYGITERVARKFGYTGHMRDLPKPLAVQIAKKAYWDVMKLDDIAALSESVALEMFDTGFNAGTSRSGKFLQRALSALNRLQKDYPDVVVDGAVGNKTVSALKAFLTKRGTEGETVMLRTLNGLQLAFYVELVERREKDERFLFGWIFHRVKI